MKLYEAAGPTSPRSKKKWIGDALKAANLYGANTGWKYNPDTNRVDIDGNMRVYDLSIPVPLGTMRGNLWFSQTMYTLRNAPIRLEGTLDLAMCKSLTSLEGCPEYIGGSLLTDYCQIQSYQHLPKTLGGIFEFKSTPLMNHLLQLFKYPQIHEVVTLHPTVDSIINKHIQGDRDILACQDELIDAGYTGVARL